MQTVPYSTRILLEEVGVLHGRRELVQFKPLNVQLKRLLAQEQIFLATKNTTFGKKSGDESEAFRRQPWYILVHTAKLRLKMCDVCGQPALCRMNLHSGQSEDKTEKSCGIQSKSPRPPLLQTSISHHHLPILSFLATSTCRSLQMLTAKKPPHWTTEHHESGRRCPASRDGYIAFRSEPQLESCRCCSWNLRTWHKGSLNGGLLIIENSMDRHHLAKQLVKLS